MAMSKKSPKLKRVEPMLPSGFRDAGPEDAILKNRILECIRNTFEVFGFDPMETPAVERTDVLLGGEKESEKIIFNVQGSREKKSDMSLRFDLTVPLARFMAANPEIPKPFMRYQIGEVYRGESPQKGRYRGFTQADIDIVGSSSSDADAEIIATISWVLRNLGIDGFVIRINSRKILDTLPLYKEGFDKKKLPKVLRILDKSDKIGVEKMKLLLIQEVGEKAAASIEEFLTQPIQAEDSARQGLDELIETIACANNMGVDKKNLSVDFSIVRGLSYYTGIVFETFLTDASDIGSIASGGRYDDLLKIFTGQPISAVGASIGVDRLLSIWDSLPKRETKKNTLTEVLILNLSDVMRKEYYEFAQDLRSAGINTALYLGDDRAFQAQMTYALKKGIRYVILYGDKESMKGVVAIKNLATREQKEILKKNLVQFFKR